MTVPSRGTTFPNRKRKMRTYWEDLFPSPLRELHFQIGRHERICCIRQKAFPSPLGELHFQIDTTYFDAIALFLFPSPLGELHFQIQDGNTDTWKTGKVSVPSRGTTFPNYHIDDNVLFVVLFRPLSGNYISKSLRYRMGSTVR